MSDTEHIRYITVKEFGDLCSIPAKNIHTYISRRKVVKRKDGLIDVNHATNKAFLLKYKAKEAPKKKTEPKQENTTESKPPKNTVDNNQTIPLNKLEQLRAEKTKEEIALLKMRRQVDEGKYIELERAIEISRYSIDTIISIFKNVVDNEVSDICNDIGVSREQLTRVRKKIKDTVNDSVVNSNKQVKSGLINLAKSNSK